MTRKEIMNYLREKGIEFNPTLKLADLEALYTKHSSGITTQSQSEPKDEPEVSDSIESKTDTQKLLEMMGGVVNKLGGIEERLKKVEGTTGNEFKNDAKKSDIDSASRQKENLDAKLVQIVEETLGVDFGIELETFSDKPGFLFTVIVPARLSDVGPSTRPAIDPENGKYKTQPDGKTPVLEDYIPQDRRSRAIGSTQSYEAIRDHCNKVRSYLVSYYTKMAKPLPEFKIRS